MNELIRPIGEWIESRNLDGDLIYRCSICNTSCETKLNSPYLEYHFCACGAEMLNKRLVKKYWPERFKLDEDRRKEENVEKQEED